MGYTGTLCASCLGLDNATGDYYGRKGTNQCQKCTPIGIQIVLIFAILAGLTLYLMYLLK